MALTLTSLLMLVTNTGQVPNQAQQQMGTRFRTWIQELDSGTHRIGIRGRMERVLLRHCLLKTLDPGDPPVLSYRCHLWDGILVVQFRVMSPVCSSP